MAGTPFRIEMLPARHGDALLVEYGETRVRRMLIDGGPLAAYPAVRARLDALPDGDRRVELLVVTHVDTDHVEGIIRMLAEPQGRWPIAPEEIWFNGYRHLEEANDLGGREGEMMSALIHYRANELWNTRFAQKAACIENMPEEGITLEGGMKLTLISPNAKALAALLADWRKSAEQWDIDPGDLADAWAHLAASDNFHPDDELTLGPGDLTDKLRAELKGRDSSRANGSSIAFLAELDGKSCLFLGDAHAKVVCEALEALGYTEKEPLAVSAVKLAHHGSKNNITPRFFELVSAKHYLVSTNGDKFEHPDKSAIEAIIAGSRKKPTLWFNYRSPFTEQWEDGAKAPGARYAARYPRRGKEGIVVSL